MRNRNPTFIERLEKTKLGKKLLDKLEDKLKNRLIEKECKRFNRRL